MYKCSFFGRMWAVESVTEDWEPKTVNRKHEVCSCNSGSYLHQLNIKSLINPKRIYHYVCFVNP